MSDKPRIKEEIPPVTDVPLIRTNGGNDPLTGGNNEISTVLRTTQERVEHNLALIQEHLTGILNSFCNPNEDNDARVTAGVKLLDFLEGGADKTIIDRLKALSNQPIDDPTIFYIAMEALFMIPCVESIEAMIIITEKQRLPETQRFFLEKTCKLIKKEFPNIFSPITEILLIEIKKMLHQLAIPLSNSTNQEAARFGKIMKEILLAKQKECHDGLLHSGQEGLEHLESPSQLLH